MEWISIKDELPKDNEIVDIFVDIFHGYVFLGARFTAKNMFNNNYYFSVPIPDNDNIKYANYHRRVTYWRKSETHQIPKLK